MKPAQLSHPIVIAWISCLLLLLAAFAIFTRAIDGPTAYEREAIVELSLLDAAPDSSIRVVVLGNSIMRHATGFPPDLQTRLRTLGHDVVVADISGAGRWWTHVKPLEDRILEAGPDLVIMQVELFGTPPPSTGNTLREDALRLLGRLEPVPTFFRLSCASTRTQDWYANRAVQRLGLPVRGLSWGSDFIEKARTSDIEVYLLPVPRSDKLTAQIGPTLDAFHNQIVDEFGPSPNVTVGPRITIGGDEYFCDPTHMNELGQARFLDHMLLDLSTLLDKLRAS